MPTVENVDNIDELQLVKQLDNVTNIQQLEQVDNVTNVETVQDVNTVHDVRKLPFPYYPLKKYNYQKGGSVHITASSNMYQAVYTPGVDCEFKGIGICFTSYNIEDTYDVMVGARYIIQGSSVKEMAEQRMLEVYEVVQAGTPIVIQFHNNSGLEKYMLYEFITLVDDEILNSNETLQWSFYWEDQNIEVGEQELCTLIINQPNYVNMDSHISYFDLAITDLNTQLTAATITCNSDGLISTDYIEDIPELQSLNLLARVNVIGIVSVTRYDKTLHIVFKNIENIGTVDPHPIEIGVSGAVNNI